ncbi:MAG: ABC transporter substrate-binding protein [Nitrospira sp.]|nr:ABC transporter substrate-binding protein [Nitrospira sp.]
MHNISRRRFLKLIALTGGAVALGDWPDLLRRPRSGAIAYASEPIKVGIIDPLSGPYSTSSIHDVHGATVAVDYFNKSGGVLGRPVRLVEADDASNVRTGLKAAAKLIKEDRVDFLMGTLNGEVALAVADLAKTENTLFMVTGAHVPELTGSGCNSHTFVFMPNARMLSKAVTPHLVKAYGNRWFMVTAETMDGRAAEQAMTDALLVEGGEVIGSLSTPFGTTDFTSAMAQAKTAKPSAVILNLYGWDLVHALKAYGKLELAKEQIGVGGMVSGEQIGRPFGYADHAGIWGLIWDPKVRSDSSRRFIQGVVDKYQHTPTSRCYHGYAAMTQILEAIQRAGTTDTQAVIKALEGHEFDGLKEGRSYFRASDHQHVQDVLVGKAYGKELGLGHYQLLATVPGDSVASTPNQPDCRLS